MGLISRVSSRTYREVSLNNINIIGKSKSSKETAVEAKSGSSSSLTIVQQLVAFNDAISSLYGAYMKGTPSKLKLVDAYLFYILITGVIQFVYCCLVGTFPFNAFLSGFISCVASFVLGVNLRMQANPENASSFDNILPERAFADFLFAHIVLHLVVANFIG